MLPALHTGPAWAGRRVGLLGGSFNPAHEGHRHISLLALRLLGLDQIWWVVSPQNPLKPVEGMASFAERFAGAQAMAKHPRILVTDIEARLATQFTADTLKGLKQRYPRTEFVWMMGADNLGQIHRWQRWRSIFAMVPVAVFDRPPYRLKMLAAPAPLAFGRHRVALSRARGLLDRPRPAWTFFACRLDPHSSTEIRRVAGKSSLMDVAHR